jgi:hypothetical protein
MARMGKTRKEYRVFVGKHLGKHPFESSRRKWKDNTELDLREIDYEDGSGWNWLLLLILGSN